MYTPQISLYLAGGGVREHISEPWKQIGEKAQNVPSTDGETLSVGHLLFSITALS
jgi:hypothetical protein